MIRLEDPERPQPQPARLQVYGAPTLDDVQALCERAYMAKVLDDK